MKTLKSAKNTNLPGQEKRKIIDMFMKNVKGKKANVTGSNVKHSGSGGHWLEKQMGVRHNAANKPDLFGFEMKNHTSSKTSFGDWGASYYIFNDPDYNISRDQFMEIFGSPNPKKNNRYSWSGRPVPKINQYNNFGQILKVDEDNNIFAVYSFEKDQRDNKEIIVPVNMKKNNLIIAKWNKDKIKKHLEKKFNQNGWFKCFKDKNGVYQNIAFGAPMNIDIWIELVREGIVFLDSGMYQTNPRNYSMWRASNNFWESLIVETY
jgi:hypothetical protein